MKRTQSLVRARPFVFGLPDDELSSVGHGHRLSKEAAPKIKKLIEDAERDLVGTTNIKKIYVSDGHRNADSQFDKWNQNWSEYYAKYKKDVLKDPDAPASAVDPEALAKYIGERLASPGRSKHGDGDAVDFKVEMIDGKKHDWNNSPFHKWLHSNKETYDLHPYAPEPWRWVHQSK